MKEVFSRDFWWGTSSSGPQTEGNFEKKGTTVWDKWFSLEPNRFFNGVGPELTSDFYRRFEEDLDLMQKLGHNSFRTSIQWSRLLPQGGTTPDPQALKFYHALIDGLLARNIEPFMCLFHFDVPLRIHEKGGFANPEVAEEYAEYARICFEHFGSKVKYWFTFCEPIVPVLGGYWYDFHYPNKIDFKRGMQEIHGILMAHSKAVRVFREAQKKKQIKDGGKIGVLLNLHPVYPRSAELESDREAAEAAKEFNNRSFLHPIFKADYSPWMKQFLKEHDMDDQIRASDFQEWKETPIDLLGINYYFPMRVKAKEYLINPKAPHLPTQYFDEYVMAGRKMNVSRGWEIYERGIHDIIMEIHQDYGAPEMFISENGMGVENEDRFRNAQGSIDDDYRIEFIQGHLKEMKRAIDAGAKVRGYHLWTFTDSWSWSNAYKNRYGFVEIDLKNNLARKIKKSGWWFKEMIEKGGF